MVGHIDEDAPVAVGLGANAGVRAVRLGGDLRELAGDGLAVVAGEVGGAEGVEQAADGFWAVVLLCEDLTGVLVAVVDAGGFQAA